VYLLRKWFSLMKRGRWMVSEEKSNLKKTFLQNHSSGSTLQQRKGFESERIFIQYTAYHFYHFPFADFTTKRGTNMCLHELYRHIFEISVLWGRFPLQTSGVLVQLRGYVFLGIGFIFSGREHVKEPFLVSVVQGHTIFELLTQKLTSFYL